MYIFIRVKVKGEIVEARTVSTIWRLCTEILKMNSLFKKNAKYSNKIVLF
jgi:hypothetical protein